MRLLLRGRTGVFKDSRIPTFTFNYTPRPYAKFRLSIANPMKPQALLLGG